MDDKEFEQSIKEYYKDKQKPENRTETIYVDVNKLIKEEKQNDKFIYKENESGYEVEFNGTKATGPTLMLAIINAYRKHYYNN